MNKTATAPTELLVNAHSRRGRESYDAVVAACARHGIAIGRVHKVTDTRRLPRIFHDIQQRAPALLIVASGDGTVSEAVDYLAGTEIELGFVPLGTTNNFARSLGLPLEIDQAIERIADGNTRRIDLGSIGGDYFTNVAGIGISAHIARHVTAKLKRRYGRLAYAITGFKLLMSHKPFAVHITDKDGELGLHFETHQVIVANGRFHAGKVIAKGTALDNRELVIFKLGGRSRLSFVWHMIDFYLGRRRSVQHSAYLIAKDVSISTSRPVPIELDGEVKYSTPVQVRVVPRALKVRC